MMEKVDEVIDILSDYIKHIISEKSGLCIEVPELTKALAELVSARAGRITPLQRIEEASEAWVRRKSQ